MPRQNRVTPFGEIIATPERGTIMGNRGVLHDEGRIRRPWRLRRWLLCRLEFKGRRRTIMAPGHWTELFFLDEATGLAAGHRPCCECQRTRFLAFRSAWAAGIGRASGADKINVATIDDRLHTERIKPDQTKRTFTANLDQLPDGVFVIPKKAPGTAQLVLSDELLVWTPGGYAERRPRPRGEAVLVLTPRSTVAAIRLGYVPRVHPSASKR